MHIRIIGITQQFTPSLPAKSSSDLSYSRTPCSSAAIGTCLSSEDSADLSVLLEWGNPSGCHQGGTLVDGEVQISGPTFPCILESSV
jgi:hypothetical protein